MDVFFFNLEEEDKKNKEQEFRQIHLCMIMSNNFFKTKVLHRFSVKTDLKKSRGSSSEKKSNGSDNEQLSFWKHELW